MERRSRQVYEFGPYRLDTAERLLLREGEPVPLTPKVYETLIALVERRGHLVEKEELMKTIWPDSFVEEANLTNNVSILRKTLGEDEHGQLYIKTVPKRGYQFTAGVRELPFEGEELVLKKRTLTQIVTEEEEVGSEEQPAALALEAGSHASVAPEPRHTRRALALPRSLMVAALLVVCAATAFGLYWLLKRPRSEEKAAAAVPFREMDISRLTTSGKVKHAAISPDGRYVAHITEEAEGDSLWVRNVAAPGSVRLAGPSPTEYVSVTFAPDGDSVYYLTLDRDKGATLLYRVPVLGGPSSVAADDVGPVGFSPDGRQIAFIRAYPGESRLIVANADGANERPLATRREPDFFRVDWNAPAWSPDGKTIACQARLNDERGKYETVVGVNVESGAQRPLTDARWSYAGQPVWLADGAGLLVTAGENTTAPVQVWHIALKSGEATRVTHDLNDYTDLSLASDSSRLAAVQDNTVSSIWVMSEGDAGRAKQIASDTGWNEEVGWTPGGRIIYRSNASGDPEIWVMNADGSEPKQLTTGARAHRGLAISPDGRYIFFASDRTGRFNIWRVDASGANLRQMTFGDGELYPSCTPDGAWVVFQRGEREPRLWRVSAEGGEPLLLTETRAARPAVSPDGELIAYHYLDSGEHKSRWRIGVVSSAGGARLKQFDLPPTLVWRFVRWSPDRQSIAYANNPGGLSDIWLQPLDGGPPRQLTDFKAEQIIAFDWSRDGRSLAFVRGAETSDVVLIEQKTVGSRQ